MIVPYQVATKEQQEEHFSLLHNLAHQSRIFSEMLKLARKLLFEKKLGTGALPTIIVTAMSSRAIETADAIGTLISRTPPLVDDAMVLARVLIETVLNAAFIARSDAEMARRYDAWGDYQAYIQEEKITRFIVSRADDEDRRAEFQRLRQRAIEQFPDFAEAKNRNQDWGGNLGKRAIVLDDITESKDAALLLDEYNALSNHVHVNSLSIRSRVQETSGKIRVGKIYNNEQKAATLYAANDALFYLCALLDEKYWDRSHEEQWWRLLFKWRPYLNVSSTTN